MKKYFSLYWLFLRFFLALTTTTCVSAQTADSPKASARQVTDPLAVVPAVTYRSVFKETSLGVEKDTASWRKANDDVGKFLRGHVDILKWEEQDGAKATKPTTPSAHKH